MEDVFLITDPNSDPDDLACMILLRTLFEEQKINLAGVVASKGKAEIREARALFAKAVLNQLGWGNVPVAVGGEYKQKIGQGDNIFYYGNEVKQLLSKPLFIHHSPMKMMEEIFHQHDKLTLLIVAPMNDVADFISYNPTLFQEKINKIVIMGGCQDCRGYPANSSHNNAVCFDAAVKVWKFATENEIPLIWVSRETVYSAQVTHDFYDELEKIAHPLAQILLFSNKKLLEALWEDIHCGRFSHFDILRFAKVFMGENHEEIHAFEDFSSVWAKVRYFNLYDAITALTLDQEVFAKSGHFETCSDNKNVLTAKIDAPDIVRNRLYQGIIGCLENLRGNK